MMMFMIAALIITILMFLKKDIWQRILAISSLGIKVSILMILYSWIKDVPYLMDVGFIYLMVSGAGVMLLLFLILRSGLE